MNFPIISVTGTKGKTTTVSIIDSILRHLGTASVKVDTTGHFVNGERASTLDDSKAAWGLVPSVCPGRYLWEFHANPALREGGVGVLECSLGCSATSGLGYRYHDVGVFLNVFEDHIGSSDRIQNRQDIVSAKDFIFTRIKPIDGYAVFNADDEYVCSALDKIPNSVTIARQLVPCGFTFNYFDLEGHLSAGGQAVTIKENKVVILSEAGTQVIADLQNIPWTFNGTFMPSAWNIMSAVAALLAHYKGELPEGITEAVEQVRLDKYGGRLTLLEASDGVRILADYAHEKVSLAMVADLARGMIADGGKLIGVVRLAHDRTDSLMIETGGVVGRAFDSLVVYDKIDGYWRKAKSVGLRFPQIEGRTSEIFSEAIRRENSNVERIIREDEAIAYARRIAAPGDVVVVIVNDNIERSIEFIQESFSADFA